MSRIPSGKLIESLADTHATKISGIVPAKSVRAGHRCSCTNITMNESILFLDICVKIVRRKNFEYGCSLLRILKTQTLMA